MNPAPAPSPPAAPVNERQDEVGEPAEDQAGADESPTPGESTAPGDAGAGTADPQPAPAGPAAEGQDEEVAGSNDTPAESTGTEDIQELEPYREQQEIAPAGDAAAPVEPAVNKPEEETRSIPLLGALTPAESSEPDPGSAKKMYTIKKGESLWVICKRELGDPMLWKDVAKVNDLSIRDVKRLRPGNQINLSVNK